MSALISASLLDSTSLQRPSSKPESGEADSGAFERLMAEGSGKKTEKREAKGEDLEGSKRTEDLLEAFSREGKAEPSNAEPTRNAHVQGRLGFERALLAAPASRPQSDTAETALPAQSAKVQAEVAGAKAGPARNPDVLKDIMPDVSGSLDPDQKLSGDKKVDALAIGRSPIAPLAGEKGATARADLVSMRTDFQPVDMDGNGAKAAAAAGPQAAKALDSVIGREGGIGTGAINLQQGQKATVGQKVSSSASVDGSKGEKANAVAAADLPADELVSETRTDPSRQVETTRDKSSEKTASGRSEPAPGKTIEKSIDPNGQFGREIGTALADTLAQSGDRAGPGSRTAAPAQSGFAPSSERVRYQAGGAAMKTLQIQLQPAHFGKLDVLMKVVAGQMTLELSVTEPETLMRLQDDREGLKTALASAGFDLDDAAVTINLRDAGTAGRPAGQSTDQQMGGRADQNASSNGQAGQSREDGGERREQSRSGDPQPHEAPRAAEQPAALERGRRSGGQVYL